MARLVAPLTIVLMVGMAWGRALLMRRGGRKAFRFGRLDKTDFWILPFAFFYFYLVFAAAFGWPSVHTPRAIRSDAAAWAGVFFCLAGLLLMAWALVSFGQSFRIGIDVERPDELVTSGVFAFSRNPIYVAFALILLGDFLIFSELLMLIYLIAAVWLFHRQVVREEHFLEAHYGEEYLKYCRRTRRYL